MTDAPRPSPDVDVANADDLTARMREARARVAEVVVGQEAVVDEVFLALAAAGHILLEGAPGLGKTLLVRTVAQVCGLDFSRIQFTPDLMPADITGANVLLHDEEGRTVTRFEPGPIFGQLILADEINRATPKTQSALLEAMQERTVTAGGREHGLPEPFFVLATQNPIEMEGTYQLPEAQLDRFLFKVRIGYPDEGALSQILDQTTGRAEVPPEALLDAREIVELQRFVREVVVPEPVMRAVVAFARSTQPELDEAPEDVQRFVRFGVSPRGAQTLILASKARALLEGRYNVAFADLEAVAAPALRHRLQINFRGAAEGVDADPLLDTLLRRAVERVRPS
jgi:MoxR-like ATPase